jgi:hypothetical protein
MNKFKNVNLDKIAFSQDGKNIILSFIDSYQGKPIGSLCCNSVLYIKLQNFFEGDGLPCFVGEVNVHELKKDELKSILGEINFSFKGSIPEFCNKNDNFFRVTVDSGEIQIYILCAAVKDDRGKLTASRG